MTESKSVLIHMQSKSIEFENSILFHWPLHQVPQSILKTIICKNKGKNCVLLLWAQSWALLSFYSEVAIKMNTQRKWRKEKHTLSQPFLVAHSRSEQQQYYEEKKIENWFFASHERLWKWCWYFHIFSTPFSLSPKQRKNRHEHRMKAQSRKTL